MADLGSWLVRAREARGLTLEDAERDTRISRRYLQALEDEQFDVIPAPVYARGFLRSYAQYIGLDPQEAMARFPRDDEVYAPPATTGRRQARQPERRTSEPAYQPPMEAPGNRPTWRRPTPLRVQGSAAPAEDVEEYDEGEDHYEPMIGVDIGVPVPNRRLDRDPAAPTRTAVVVGVAIAAIVFVIALALFVSRLGDGEDAGSPLPDVAGDVADGEATDEDGSAVEDPTSAPQEDNGGSAAAPGTVPNLVGMTEEAAVAAIQAAGYVENIIRGPSSEDAGTVVDQAPAATEERPAGTTVTIAVSTGPE